MKKLNMFAGAAVASWLLAAMVIAAELVAPFKSLLAAVFTHHWIGKVVIVSIAFFAAGCIMKKNKSFLGMKLEKAAWYSSVLSLVAILVFYVIEFFK